MKSWSLRTLALGLLVALSACSGTGATNTMPPVDSSGALPPAPQSAPSDPSVGTSGASVAAPTDAPSPTTSAAPSDAPAATASPETKLANWSDYPLDKAWKNESTHGSWRAHSNGDGTITVVSNETISNALRIAPKTSKNRNETHAGLVTTTANFDDFDVTVDLQTVKQLRTGSAPNAREAGWFLWHYTDDRHFYYFAPKTNGWELGKADPEYAGGLQVLASGTSPTFPIGTLQKIRVVQSGDAITVYDNGLKIVSFTDKDAPYSSGRFGLYSKDAEAHFGSLQLTTSAGAETL